MEVDSLLGRSEIYRDTGIGLVLISCDHFWSNLSGLQYAFCDGKCYGTTRCGWSCLDLGYAPASPYWVIGACDYYWRSYSTTLHLAACGGDIRYIVGHIGSWCLCMQFRDILAEFTLGACWL